MAIIFISPTCWLSPPCSSFSETGRQLVQKDTTSRPLVCQRVGVGGATSIILMQNVEVRQRLGTEARETIR